jgi:hypothetical protein
VASKTKLLGDLDGKSLADIAAATLRLQSGARTLRLKRARAKSAK